jgi:osmoprotectant transport system permease protein
MQEPSLWDYVSRHQEQIVQLSVAQVELVLLVMALSAVIGIAIGALVWNRVRLADAAIGAAGAALTIPSLALLAFLLPVVGLGWPPAVIALVIYAQLPIIRNTVVGLRGVEPAVLESARAMGMASARVLLRVQLPLAWPVIVAGLRVAAMVTFGISAVASYLQGPGLGELLFNGLASLGSINSMNKALTGALGITMLALAFDALLVLLSRLTTARGIRA